MNESTLLGPCADYEHDLVELIEGTLGALVWSARRGALPINVWQG